jgi:hypothetical protein
MAADHEDKELADAKPSSFPYFYFDLVARVLPGALLICALSLWPALGIVHSNSLQGIIDRISVNLGSAYIVWAIAFLGASYYFGTLLDGAYRGVNRHVFLKACERFQKDFPEAAFGRMLPADFHGLVLQCQSAVLSLERAGPSLLQQSLRISADIKMTDLSLVAIGIGSTAIITSELLQASSLPTLLFICVCACMLGATIQRASHYLRRLYIEFLISSADCLHQTGSNAVQKWIETRCPLLTVAEVHKILVSDPVAANAERLGKRIQSLSKTILTVAKSDVITEEAKNELRLDGAEQYADSLKARKLVDAEVLASTLSELRSKLGS